MISSSQIGTTSLVVSRLVGDGRREPTHFEVFLHRRGMYLNPISFLGLNTKPNKKSPTSLDLDEKELFSYLARKDYGQPSTILSVKHTEMLRERVIDDCFTAMGYTNQE